MIGTHTQPTAPAPDRSDQVPARAATTPGPKGPDLAIAAIGALKHLGPSSGGYFTDTPAETVEIPKLMLPIGGRDLMLTDRLGNGQFGQVYLAYDRSDGREYAVKLLPATRGPVPADAAAAILLRGVPGVVAVHEVDLVAIRSPSEGLRTVLAIVSDRLPMSAKDISSAFVGSRRPDHSRILQSQHDTTILDIAKGALTGLNSMHERGMTHGDIQPANVLIEGKMTKSPTGPSIYLLHGTYIEMQGAKLTDFSCAATFDGWIARIERGDPVGHPRYIAPELLSNHPAARAAIAEGDRAKAAGYAVRADLFQVGVLINELYTGEPGTVRVRCARTGETSEPVPPSADRRLPPGIREITEKLLSADPDKRYGSAREVLADITRYERGETPLAVSERGFLASVSYRVGKFFSRFSRD